MAERGLPRSKHKDRAGFWSISAAHAKKLLAGAEGGDQLPRMGYERQTREGYWLQNSSGRYFYHKSGDPRYDSHAPIPGTAAWWRQPNRRRNTRRRRNGPAEVGELFTLMNSTSHPRIRNQYDSIVKNLTRKIAKGTYDRAKAPKLWLYLANTAAQYYVQEYRIAERTYGSYGIFSMADRKAAAERMARQFEANTKIEIRPAQQNPRGGSRFDRCVRSVSARGGATDPHAVCAAAGRKKYGKRKFQAMAARGLRRAIKRAGGHRPKAKNRRRRY